MVTEWSPISRVRVELQKQWGGGCREREPHADEFQVTDVPVRPMPGFRHLGNALMNLTKVRVRNCKVKFDEGNGEG